MRDSKCSSATRHLLFRATRLTIDAQCEAARSIARIGMEVKAA
jgi:hypothetical protein